MTEKMKEGWEPVGGVSVSSIYRSHSEKAKPVWEAIYAQAMIKRK